MKLLVSILVSVAMLVQESSAECVPFSICDEKRDSITMDPTQWSRFPPGTDLTWFVRPKQTTGSLLLVFKEFSPTTQIKVVMMKDDGTMISNQYVGGSKANNFDVITQGVREMVIVAPNTPETSFKLAYYGDCEIVRDGLMQYPPQVGRSECWILNFTLNQNELMKRMYVMMRDVKLDEKFHLKFTDVTTMEIVADLSGERDYEIFGFDTVNSRTVMMELTCEHGQICPSMPRNSFNLNSYTMNEGGIACIELQTQCSQIVEQLRPPLCYSSCPALEEMLENEAHYETNSPALIRSGYQVRQRSRGYVAKNSVLIGERSTSVNPVRGGSKADGGGKKKRCPLNPRFCNCPRNVDLRKFCYIKGKCREHGKCTWACIFANMTVCVKIKFLSNKIKLL